MKTFFLWMTLGLFANSLYGQNFDGPSEFYSNGVLLYGLVDNNNIYLSIQDSTKKCYIWQSQINNGVSPVTYKVGRWRLDGAWNKGDDIISALIPYFQIYRIYTIRQPVSQRKELNIRDTFHVENLDHYYCDINVPPFIDYRNSFGTAVVKTQDLSTLYYSYQKVSEIVNQVINIDIYSQNSNFLNLFMRDKDALYVYTTEIDTTQEKTEWNRTIEVDWQEKIVYASPEFDPDYPPHKYSESYSGKKTQFNAIMDSLFFEGNYKVIMQENQTYVFNRKYGHIYLLTDTEVIRIGTIRLTDDYPAVRGHKYIIEDRDRGSILLFAPVDWYDDIHPKPTIEIISQQEFCDKYNLN